MVAILVTTKFHPWQQFGQVSIKNQVTNRSLISKFLHE